LLLLPTWYFPCGWQDIGETNMRCCCPLYTSRFNLRQPQISCGRRTTVLFYAYWAPLWQKYGHHSSPWIQ
jgi:hypothetical protein